MTLPRGWAQTTLGECQGKTGNIDPSSYPDEEFDLYSVPSYSTGAPNVVRGCEIGSVKQIIMPGDVLLCKIVPHIRRVWAVPKPCGRRQIASGEWIILRGHGLDPNFLRRYLLTNEFHAQFMKTVSGVGGSLMRARPSEAGKITIYVPPLAEQRRIITQLDELTVRLVRARAELKRVTSLVSHLKSTAVASIFGIDERHRTLVSEVLVDIRYGTARKCSYEGGATPVLRIPNVQNAKIKLNNLKFADFDTKELSKLALVPGDILVIRSNGSVSLVGRSAVTSEAERGMLYAGYLIRLRINQTLCLPEYLQFFLQSEPARNALESAARSTSGVHNINTEHLRALALPLPDIHTQDEIVNKLQVAFARAEHLETEAARAAALLDRLEASILAKAFHGELVPQVPADEPAFALLDRIRAERGKAPVTRRGRARGGTVTTAWMKVERGKAC